MNLMDTARLSTCLLLEQCFLESYEKEHFS